MEVAAAIISITEVTIRTSSKLWKLSNQWRDAPEDLHRLRDDISRTQQFFDEVRQNAVYTSASWREDSPTQSELKKLLADGNVVIERIEMVVDKLTGNKPSLDKLASLGKMRRVAWMANAQTVASLRRELGNIVSSTCRMLVALNVSVSTEIHASLRRSQTDIEASIGNHVWGASERITSRFDQAVELSRQSIIHHMDRRIEAMENKLLDTVKQSVIQELTVDRQESVFSYSGTKNPHRAEYTPYEKYTGAAWASLMQHITPHTSQVTPHLHCPCECHSQRRYTWAMASLRSAIGFITLSYTGRKSSPSCPNPSCLDHHHRDHTNLHLTYHFPTWLVRIAISVFVSSNLNGTPQLNLRIVNHLPASTSSSSSSQFSNNIFSAIRRDDSLAVKTLLSTGKASPLDVIGEAMHPPLWVAVILRREEIIRILLQAGADPYHAMVAYGMRSPVRVAFELSLSRDPVERAVAGLFDLGGYCEEEGYSALARAVTGQLFLDLRDALREPKYLGDINKKAGDGHTPLLLAVIRGDVEAVGLLLRAGAEVDARTLEGMGAVHLACRGLYVDILRLLLQRSGIGGGADVHAVDNYDRNALMFAAGCCCASEDGLQEMLELLVRCGADVNYRIPRGASVLDYACMRGTEGAVRFLVENGAEVNSRDEAGVVAICFAVTRRKHGMVKLLLERGADVRNVDGAGWSILHWLARDGDAETLRIFTERKMRGLNTAAKDKNGKTPYVLFSERIPRPSSEMARLFEELLVSCEEGLDEKSEEEEEFADAVETWDGKDEKLGVCGLGRERGVMREMAAEHEPVPQIGKKQRAEVEKAL